MVCAGCDIVQTLKRPKTRVTGSVLCTDSGRRRRLGREQLRPCVEELHALHQMARDLPQQAVVDKFSKDKFLAVSQLEPPASISGWV